MQTMLTEIRYRKGRLFRPGLNLSLDVIDTDTNIDVETEYDLSG